MFDKHSAALLNACGYTCERYEASWEDIGGPENGPHLIGGPAYDEWRHGNEFIIVCDGEVVESGTDQTLPDGWEQ